MKYTAYIVLLFLPGTLYVLLLIFVTLFLFISLFPCFSYFECFYPVITLLLFAPPLMELIMFTVCTWYWTIGYIRFYLPAVHLSPQGLHRGIWDENYGAKARTWAFGCRLPTRHSPDMAMGQPTHSTRAPQCPQPTALGPHGAPTSSPLTQGHDACSLQGASAPQL